MAIKFKVKNQPRKPYVIESPPSSSKMHRMALLLSVSELEATKAEYPELIVREPELGEISPGDIALL